MLSTNFYCCLRCSRTLIYALLVVLPHIVLLHEPRNIEIYFLDIVSIKVLDRVLYRSGMFFSQNNNISPFVLHNLKSSVLVRSSTCWIITSLSFSLACFSKTFCSLILSCSDKKFLLFSRFSLSVMNLTKWNKCSIHSSVWVKPRMQPFRLKPTLTRPISDDVLFLIFKMTSSSSSFSAMNSSI